VTEQQTELFYKQIIIENRFRKEYTNIKELTISIENVGLIQPIAVEERDGKYYLLAGGRRMKALSYIKEYITNKTAIPCKVYSDIDDYERKAIELFENVHREDMTWAEEAQLRTNVHELFVAQKGGAMRGKGQSLAKTAEFLGISTTALHQDLTLSDNIQRLPSLAKKETRREAVLVVSDLKKSLKREKAVKKAKATIL